jgi:2-hydroxychromene-2-carboxylate isomerase
MTKTWKVFWDLQCPFSAVSWKNLPAIKERFGSEYTFEIVLTSLAFHPQAFPAQCGASLIEGKKGREAAMKYVNTCFEKQETYMNAALGDARKSEIDEIFAGLAEAAGVLDESFTKEDFLAGMHDWEMAVKPANTEHKIALGHGAYSTPKYMIDGKLVDDTESAWGPDEWAEKLKTL